MIVQTAGQNLKRMKTNERHANSPTYAKLDAPLNRCTKCDYILHDWKLVLVQSSLGTTVQPRLNDC